MGRGVATLRCIQSRAQHYAIVACRYTNNNEQARAPFGRAAKAAAAKPQLAIPDLLLSV